MEELFVYALLYSEGFDVWPLYADMLDKLFIEDPENEKEWHPRRLFYIRFLL